MKTKFLCQLLSILLLVASAHVASATPVWGRDYFPNIELVDQDGNKLRFYDDVIKGKVVALNFIFTSCPYSCPLETAKLIQVRKELGDRVGKDVFFYSISIDPENDTVPVLKKYTEKFKIGSGWKFLTGKKDEINLLRSKLGLFNLKNPDEKLADHNLSFIVGNETTGQWMKRSPMDNAKLLASLLRDDLQNFKEERKDLKSYEHAPAIAEMQTGETLFRTRCLACHTVGGGDSVGPDLIGVTERRDRSWLVRWLKTPDKMLAEKDPIALGLYLKYKEVPMPNLQLSDQHAEALIEYIKSETVKAESARKVTKK